MQEVDLETQIVKEKINFELLPMDGKSKALPLKKKKSILGSSFGCDLVLTHESIAGIHAIIEYLGNNNFKIYDLNSGKGVWVNDEKGIVLDLKLGDKIRLGQSTYSLKALQKEDLPLPPLNMLKEDFKKPSEKLPVREDIFVPRVSYPLEKDPRADFSEYIFEDAHTLYPIFNYQPEKSAVEVIVSFKNRIYSIDYLPEKKGIYHLTGSGSSKKEIEYAYLGKNESIGFIEIDNGHARCLSLNGYEWNLVGSEEKIKGVDIELKGDEIVQYVNNDIKIFVRLTDAPPKVAPAPIFRRDEDFKKYLLLMLILVFSFLGPISFFTVDKELEKEKVPERIATILYKRKLTVSKNKVVDKTEDKKKEVAQKSPKLSEKKDMTNKESDSTKKANQAVAKNTGSKNVKAVGDVKKATPNKGPKDVKKDIVKPTNKQGSSNNNSKSVAVKKSNAISPTKGTVDTYKSFDFSSTVNNVLAKGGNLKDLGTTTTPDSEIGQTNMSDGASSATLKTAKVSSNIGRLSGAARGKLDDSKGVSGLVDKKSIYTAGLPYKTVVLGGMDPDVIRQKLIEHIPQFRYCYQRALDTSKQKFNGVVKLNFIIGASGHVGKAGVDSVSAIPNTVRNCVVNVLKGIRFPEPLGGGIVEVNQPFNFYPVEK